MPYPDPSAENAHFFFYEGVDVYIERRDKHSQEPLLEFWYSTSRSIGSPERFDVRELASPGATAMEKLEGKKANSDNEAVEVEQKVIGSSKVKVHNSAGREKHMEIIKEAIDRGEIPK